LLSLDLFEPILTQQSVFESRPNLACALQTFTRWWNSWLSERQLSITDLCEDIKPGVLPIVLLEILSKSTCGRYVKAPKTTFQRLENLNLFLEQLKIKSIKLVNIGAEDLAGGSRKLVLGLTWTLILAFEVKKAGINELLEWVQEKVKSYGIVLDGGWQRGFSDGRAFCALVHDSEPTALDFEGSQRLAPAERLTRAFSAAEKLMGVPQLLDESDFVSDGKIDEKSIILYVTKLRQGREAFDERRHIGTAEAEAKAAEAAAAKKSAVKPNSEASKALASKVVALKAAAEATVAKKAAEKAAELQASEEAAERAARVKSAADKGAAEEAEEAKKAVEKRAMEEQEAAATLKAARAVSPASEEEAAKRAAWAKAAAERIAAQEAAAAKATAAKAAGAAAVIEAEADARAAAQAAEEEEARAAAEKVGLLLLRKDAEARAAKAREQAELAEAAMEEQLAAADRATLAMAEQLLMQRREHEAVLAEQLREQQRRLEAEMADKLQAAMGAQVSAAARLARAQEAMAEQLEEQQRQHEAAIRQQQVAMEARLAAAARPAVGGRDVIRDVKMSFKRRTDTKNVGEPSAETAREEDPFGNLLGTVARGVDEHVGKPVRQWAAKLSATEAKSLETVSKEAVTEASAKARLLEHRDELIAEAAELSDRLGARRQRYDQAVGDPTKALLGSTADESRALLESLHDDCAHELISMWHLARAANDGSDKCGKRWELTERFERLVSMHAAYVEDMSKNSLPTQVDSVVGDVKEALAALDTQWDLMTASSTAYETALGERMDSHLEMGAFLNELELGSPMPVEPPTPLPLPVPVEPPTPPPRSERKSEMERKRFLLGARNLDRAPMPPLVHTPQSSEKSCEDADEKVTVETDKITKPTKNAGEITEMMGMGAAETGKFFNSAGAAVGDGMKATGSLVISGLEKTFETLGVTAGFQAIFGEEIDKSDAGLEAAFAKVDKDKSGKISPEEMKAYVLSRYKKGLAEKAIDEMMATADTNNDGEIDLAEFKIIMRAGPSKSDGAIVGAVDASVAATVGGVKAIGDGAAFIGLQSVEGMKAAGAATVDSAKAVGTATVNVVKAVGTATVDGTTFVGKKGLEGAKVVGSATVDGVTFVGKKGLEGAKAVGDGVKAIENAAAEKVAAEKAAAEKAAAEKAAAEKATTDVESPAKPLSQHEASVLKARERIEQFMRGVSAELPGPPELSGTGFSALVPREVVFNGAGEANVPSAAQTWNVQHTNSQRRAANMDVIQGIAKILKEYPQVLCEVHGETSPANTAPEPLAVLLGLDPVRDVAECMSILAHKRAQACLDALVAAGVPPEQLFVTYKGMGGKVGVQFMPSSEAILDVKSMPSSEAAARATSWPWRWEPGELAIDGSLQHVLEPLASFLEQNGIEVKHDKLAMHVEEDMLVVSEPVSPVRGAATQIHRSQVHVPTLNVFCNGIEFANAAFSKWDRHLKTALKRFLNANLASSWGYGCTPLRTGFGFGTEWNGEAVTALQIFLKNNGADDLEITNQMGLSGHALFGVCDKDPTIMALQAFLNRQLVLGALP
jgi:hypothetical protein